MGGGTLGSRRRRASQRDDRNKLFGSEGVGSAAAGRVSQDVAHTFEQGQVSFATRFGGGKLRLGSKPARAPEAHGGAVVGEGAGDIGIGMAIGSNQNDMRALDEVLRTGLAAGEALK